MSTITREMLEEVALRLGPGYSVSEKGFIGYWVPAVKEDRGGHYEKQSNGDLLLAILEKMSERGHAVQIGRVRQLVDKPSEHWCCDPDTPRINDVQFGPNPLEVAICAFLAIPVPA